MSKMRAGIEADLAQAGEVLARGVQDPLLAGHRLGELARSRRSPADRTEEPGSAPEHLDQVGALRVAEPGCAFGVDRDRPVARGDRRDGVEVPLRVSMT